MLELDLLVLNLGGPHFLEHIRLCKIFFSVFVNHFFKSVGELFNILGVKGNRQKQTVVHQTKVVQNDCIFHNSSGKFLDVILSELDNFFILLEVKKIDILEAVTVAKELFKPVSILQHFFLHLFFLLLLAENVQVFQVALEHEVVFSADVVATLSVALILFLANWTLNLSVDKAALQVIDFSHVVAWNLLGVSHQYQVHWVEVLQLNLVNAVNTSNN